MREAPTVLLACGVFLASACTAPPPDETAVTAPREEAAVAGRTATPPRPAGGEVESVEVLEARVRELEAALRDVQKTGGDRQLADVETLMALLARNDGPGLSREIEGLLLGGDEGFARLHEFLHEADVEREKIIALAHEPQMIFALLRLVALHVDETARFSGYLMDATRDRPASFIRREIFNFLPVFLNYHRGRFPELRRRLEEEILFQLKAGGDWMYKIFLAMRDLEFEPPTDAFLPVLREPGKAGFHPKVIDYLVERGDEGVDTLLRYLHQVEDATQPSVRQALHRLVRLEGAGGDGREAGLLDPFFEHPDADMRAAAFAAYFSSPRDERDAARAVEFFNSDARPGQKKAFLLLLYQRNRKTLAAVGDRADGIADADLRALVERTADRVKPRANGAAGTRGRGGETETGRDSSRDRGNDG